MQEFLLKFDNKNNFLEELKNDKLIIIYNIN